MFVGESHTAQKTTAQKSTGFGLLNRRRWSSRLRSLLNAVLWHPYRDHTDFAKALTHPLKSLDKGQGGYTMNSREELCTNDDEESTHGKKV